MSLLPSTSPSPPSSHSTTPPLPQSLVPSLSASSLSFNISCIPDGLQIDFNHSAWHSPNRPQSPDADRERRLQHAYFYALNTRIHPQDIYSNDHQSAQRVICKPLPGDIIFPDMASVDISAPASPPDLAYSKSSKSSNSSYRSPSPSESGGTSFEKLAHFEEVELEEPVLDSIEDCNVKPESRPTLKRPSPRPSFAREGSRRTSHGSISPAPSHHSDGRSPPPPAHRMQYQPGPGNIRRVFTSPSSPQLALSPHMPVSSRSPSPKSAPYGQAVFSPALSSRSNSWDRLSLPHQRRMSWQPGRKTIKELEDECNDDDEEVPDEAILENVPISPMPGSVSSFGPRSPMPSPHALSIPRRKTSPNNLNGAHSGLHSAKVPKMAKRPSAPIVLPNGQLSSSRSPRSSRPLMMPHSATTGGFPHDSMGHKQRSKSWSDHLSDEARTLSAALEEYAESTSNEKRDSAHSYTSNGSSDSPPRPDMSKKRTKTSIIELPPFQKGNIMIDPLPISKEKEAVLTRTRPSWLPPKNKKEEKKHLKEWKQMMTRAEEADKKRLSKEKEQLETKEEIQGSIARVWEMHILPHWEHAIVEPRTRQVWWRGVHPPCRAEVWRRAIGNDLNLTPKSFQAALQRANEAEEKVAEMPDEERGRSMEAAWFDAIARDVPNVIRDQPVYQEGTPLHQALTDVLKAYAMYRNDVGYVYGSHLIAGTLCLILRPADAFIMLANVMNRPIPLAFLVHDQAAMTKAHDLVLSTLKYKCPKLHDHLTSPITDVKPEEYLDPMFRCLFAHNLPPEHVNRIWDVFAFEGDKTLVRAAVAVLMKLEGKLYGTRQEVLDLISWRNNQPWPIGTEDEFIEAMREAGKVDNTNEA